MPRARAATPLVPLSSETRLILDHCDGVRLRTEVAALLVEAGFAPAPGLDALQRGLDELEELGLLLAVLPTKVAHCVAQPVGEETIIYNPADAQAHLLNPTCALVYKHCDGSSEFSDLAQQLGADAVSESLTKLQSAGLVTVSSLGRRQFVGAALASVAAPSIVSLLIPAPAQAASAACAADCVTTSCVTINQPPNGSPPTGPCATCCGTCGGPAPNCGTCPGDCSSCNCMRSMTIVGGAGGSCLGDTVTAFRSCLKATGDPVCTPVAACQANCNAARAAAVTAGVGQYACCTNCT